MKTGDTVYTPNALASNRALTVVELRGRLAIIRPAGQTHGNTDTVDSSILITEADRDKELARQERSKQRRKRWANEMKADGFTTGGREL